MPIERSIKLEETKPSSLKATQACNTKHPMAQKPKYWNGSGSRGEMALKGMANRGKESVKTIELLNSMPYFGFKPRGHSQGAFRKNAHPR